MLSCIIIEDQSPARKILQKYISDIDQLILKESFSNAVDAKAYLEGNVIDLVFLDIHLPQVSGIEYLKNMKNHPYTILTTAYSEYALESYEYNVIDYLLKPFSFERFSQAIYKVNSFVIKKEERELEISHDIYIKSGSEIFKVKPQDIYYIKSDADYTELITESKKYLSSHSLKDWILELGVGFCQVHKSYIVNKKHVEKISTNKIYLSGEVSIPIGRAYKKVFMDQFKRV